MNKPVDGFKLHRYGRYAAADPCLLPGYCVALCGAIDQHLSDASRMAQWSIIGDVLSGTRCVHIA
jgi:hypothetical protein